MKRAWYKSILLNIIISIFSALLSPALSAAPSMEGIQIYQKNIHLSEEHKQKLADDIDRYHNANNIWDELRSEFALPHYEDNPQVQEQIQWFMSHQDFLMNTATRAAPYLYFILQQVHKRHLPAEVVLLPIIESGYNPFACSPVGATGIWQMMPGTASGFGIKQNWWYDGRRDVIASTRAALDYLSYLGSFFEGNWLLGIAAYDTGEGNVLSGIRKNIRDGLNTDYWSLPLAQETKIYIPRLLALAVIISHPDEYPIPFPPVQNAPYLAQIDVGAQIDLQRAARLAGISLKKLKQLNPGFSRAATEPRVPSKLILPIEHVEQFSENLARSPVVEHTTTVMNYKVRSGDTLFSIARKFNTSPNLLRKSNPRLTKNLKPGNHLVIPHATTTVANSSDDSPQQIENSSPTPTEMMMHHSTNKTYEPVTHAFASNSSSERYKLHPGDTLYMVRNNDDIIRIAKRFRTTPNALLAVNQLSHNHKLRPGDQLIIPTHSAVATKAQHYQLTSGDTVYMVRRGDNIEKIAKKFHTTPSAIRVANILSNNALTVGDRLIIPTHIG